ncbi:MAG: ABC transporter permease [Bacteroidales bacterium]
MANKLNSILVSQSIRQLKYPWVRITVGLAAVIALPLMIVFGNFTTDGGETWQHILRNLLPAYVTNTLILMVGVSVLTFVMGVSTAWVTSVYHFPGRKFFRWALILPIALPAYISGFTWAGILDYASPVYVFMRNQWGLDTGQFLFFNILSMPGAIIILSLAFYPYVYLITRAYFTRQSSSLLEVAASLGKSPASIFFQVALPMARPAIVAGVSLALMEVLNDYGVARYFGVDTFTTGIFTAWFAFSHPPAALKLSAYLMIFVLILILVEKFQRRKMRYDTQGHSYRPMQKKKLNKTGTWAAIMVCSLPFALGFLFPAMMLVYWSIKTVPMVVNYRFWELLGNSFLLAAMASAIVVSLAVFTAFTVRSFPSALVRLLAKIATLGYALPGAVVAIGILIPFLWLDSHLAVIGGNTVRIALTGTWFALLYAYLVRFMAVGYNSIESGMEGIPQSLDEASRSMGMSHSKTLVKINIPLLTGSLISGALLVFIDVLKELPLTLILRPFNFDTLAIRAFEFASDERIAEAAPASLIIVLTGLIPVLLLNRITGKY